VGVRGLVRGRLGEQRHELRVAGDIGRVDAQRGGGEERVQVEVALTRLGIDDPGATAEVQIQDDMEAVRQNVTRKTAPDIVVAGHRSPSAWAGHGGGGRASAVASGGAAPALAAPPPAFTGRLPPSPTPVKHLANVPAERFRT